MAKPTPAKYMTDEALAKELKRVGKRWDDLRSGDCDGGGSPGEWLWERMGELAQEIKRRAMGEWEMDRIKDDQTLKDTLNEHGQTFIHNPIIVVQTVEGGKQQYFIHPTNLDPMMNEPTLFGILLSDLVDHITAAYAPLHGGRERDLRDHIIKTLKRENQLKDEQPGRGSQRGAMIMPKSN